MKINKYLDIKTMNQQILEQDIFEFVNRCTYWENFKNKRIVVTGATGLIGSIMVKCLRALNAKYSLGITVYSVVRNVEKARMQFSPIDSSIVIVPLRDFSSIETSLIGGNVHYIIHAAAPTASSFFTNMPVETYDGVVRLTRFILERAKNLHCQSMVYLSSLEVYGEILDDADYVTEDKQGYVNPLSARSSYSMGKRASECLCYGYFSEYKLPVKIARLAQTFGAGVASDDNRVFAYIARAAMNGEDIVLNTPGAVRRNYCYTVDAIDAIFRILLFGKDGNAYNVANEQTYISVRDMAEQVIKTFSPTNKVVIKQGDDSCYPPTTKVKMSAKKLESLGWQPRYDLNEMFERLICWFS